MVAVLEFLETVGNVNPIWDSCVNKNHFAFEFEFKPLQHTISKMRANNILNSAHQICNISNCQHVSFNF